MLKKTITYKDFNGRERTEDFYFNLNKSEVLEMEMSADGGLIEKIQRVVAAQDGNEIMKIFKEFLSNSYGIKVEDGKRFSKSDEIWRSFYESPAYDVLFWEMVTHPEVMAAFIEAVIPKPDPA